MAFRDIFGGAFRPPFGGGAGKTRYTLTLQPDAASGIDTDLRENIPDTNFGTQTGIFTRTSAGLSRFGLIKFSGISVIPAGATIISATAYFYCFSSVAAIIPINIYRILSANSSWTETGSTWNYAVPSSTRWAGDAGSDGGSDAGCSVSGTDYSTTLFGTFSIGKNDALGVEYSSVLSVTEFALMLAANDGMVLRSTTDNLVSVCSSDHATAEYRPKLVVVYDA